MIYTLILGWFCKRGRGNNGVALLNRNNHKTVFAGFFEKALSVYTAMRPVCMPSNPDRF